MVEGSPDDLVFELKNHRPVIVGVAKPTIKDAVAHYEVVVGMHGDSQRIATLDPAAGLRQNTFTGFLSEWQGAGRVLLAAGNFFCMACPFTLPRELGRRLGWARLRWPQWRSLEAPSARRRRRH